MQMPKYYFSGEFTAFEELFLRLGAQVRTYQPEDFLARAACHETDHLDGKLYLRLVKRFLDPEELDQ